MSNKVLYFPYINVPNSIWFTRMLLYWDEVGAIVPYDFIEQPSKLDEHTRSLVQESLVRQIMPGNYLYQIPEFSSSFTNYLNLLGDKKLSKRTRAFRGGSYFKIHIEKMDGLKYDRPGKNAQAVTDPLPTLSDTMAGEPSLKVPMISPRVTLS